MMVIYSDFQWRPVYLVYLKIIIKSKQEKDDEIKDVPWFDFSESMEGWLRLEKQPEVPALIFQNASFLLDTYHVVSKSH